MREKSEVSPTGFCGLYWQLSQNSIHVFTPCPALCGIPFFLLCVSHSCPFPLASPALFLLGSLTDTMVLSYPETPLLISLTV